MSEAFDFAKSQARRHIAEQQGKSAHSFEWGGSDVPVELVNTVLNLPVDLRYHTPLRDPVTGKRLYPAGYAPAGSGGAGE